MHKLILLRFSLDSSSENLNSISFCIEDHIKVSVKEANYQVKILISIIKFIWGTWGLDMFCLKIIPDVSVDNQGIKG